ncbi:MAG: hypothetical protein KBA26_07375 [Candidatus Delongbacteria bacterium]|nr:hypothetical protein [Candidatus Delongbacteria bacterium]
MIQWLRTLVHRPISEPNANKSVFLDYHGIQIQLNQINANQLNSKHHNYIVPSLEKTDLTIACHELRKDKSSLIPLNNHSIQNLSLYLQHYLKKIYPAIDKQTDIVLERMSDPAYLPLYNPFCYRFLSLNQWRSSIVILPVSNYSIIYDPQSNQGIYCWYNQFRTNFLLSENLFYLALSLYLAGQGGVLLHGSALLYNGQAYLFLAESGGGKSTLFNLCSSCQHFSDDAVAVRQVDGNFEIVPLPFGHHPHLSSTTAQAPHPIKAVFFLKHHSENRIEPLNKFDALTNMLHHLHYHLFMTSTLSRQAFETCHQIVSRIPVFYLNFHIRNDSVFNDIYQFLNH